MFLLILNLLKALTMLNLCKLFWTALKWQIELCPQQILWTYWIHFPSSQWKTKLSWSALQMSSLHCNSQVTDSVVKWHIWLWGTGISPPSLNAIYCRASFSITYLLLPLFSTPPTPLCLATLSLSISMSKANYATALRTGQTNSI